MSWEEIKKNIEENNGRYIPTVPKNVAPVKYVENKQETGMNDFLGELFNRGKKLAFNSLKTTVVNQITNPRKSNFIDELKKNVQENFLSYMTGEKEKQQEESGKNKNILEDAGSLANLYGLGVSTGNKEALNFIETGNENTFQGYKNLKERQFLTSPKVSEENKAIAKTQDNLLLNSKGIKIDDENKIETNLVKKAIRDSINEDNKKIQEEQQKIDDEAMKTLGEIAPSMGQQLTGMALSTVNPVLGTSYFYTSAGGSYIEDGLQRGMSEKQAWKYGNIMAALESASESVITGQQLGKVSKAFSGKEISKKLLNSYGFNIFENAVQEAVMEPAQELTAQIVAGNDKADWTNMGERIFKSGFNGGLMGGISNGVTYGLEKSGNVYNKIKNGEAITQNEYKEALQENIDRFGREAVEKAIKNGATEVYQEINNINQEQTIANNNQSLYNNTNLGEIKNVPINEVLSLQKSNGGYRNEQEMTNLREDIKKNGIKNPIELVMNNDGSVEIENGNHRLQIAKELGLKEVPIKFVESWDNMGNDINIREEKQIQEVKGEYERGNRNIKETNIINAPVRTSERNSINNSNEFKNGRTGAENDRLPRGIQEYNNRSSSNTTYEKNINEQSKITPFKEASNEASINLSESNTPIPPTKGETINKTLNPREISNLNQQDASTTPVLPNKKYQQGNKESNFYSNITKDSKFLNQDLRQEMEKEESIKYYKGITNQETLEKAYKSLNEEGKNATINWFNKQEKNVTAEDVAKGWILLKQYQDNGDYISAVEVAKKMRNMGSNAGQTVQAYNILSRLTPEGMFYYAQSELSEAYNKMVEGKSKKWIEANANKFDLTPQDTKVIMDTMKEVSTMEDGRDKQIKLAEIQKLIQDKIPPTIGQGIKAWMRNSMLLNPKTLHRNILGNAVMVPVNITSDAFSTGIDKLISKKTGVRTTGITKEGVKGYVKGFGKGSYESYDDFRRGINTRDMNGNKFEIGEGKSFKDKGIGKALNRIDNFLNFALDVGDRPFYEATFINSINNQLVLNNTTEVTSDMIEIASTEALQRTWQDSNSYTSAVLAIRNILNGKIDFAGIHTKGLNYGLGDILIPFAKTPANLTKAIVDYSPVGLVKSLAVDARKFNNSLNNGQYSPQLQHKFVQNLGKGMAGSLLYVLGYGLAKAGIATGESDDDKDIKNFMKNSMGISSYSIKIGDKTFSYDWAQPIAVPLSIMTNYVKYSKDNPDASAIDKAIKSMNIGTEQLLEQSFMQSLNTVLNGNGTTLENLSKAVLDLPARAIPTFSKQIADMVDDTQRTTFEYNQPVQSAINSVKSKIPFVSKTLPVATDTLGNEIKKYGGENNLWNVMFNPANVNKGKLSKTGAEIYRLYEETGEKNVFPVTAPYYINSKGKKINMTAEQRSKYQKVTGNYTGKIINNLLLDPDYKKLSNENKAKLISEIISDSNAKAKYDILKIDTKEYAKLRETLKNVDATSYYNYKFKTKEMKKDKEKIEVLVNSNYNNKDKRYLYENYIRSKEKEDTISTYEIMKNAGLDIDEWLKYSQQEFVSDKEDDGTLNGKSVEGEGSKKDKTFNYVNNAKMSYEQRLLLLGMQFKLGNSERRALVNYINTLQTDYSTRLKIFNKIKGITVYKDGTIKY